MLFRSTVSGSDRNYDCGVDPELFGRLCHQGISLFPQDGSGITEALDEVVVSAAVEEGNPDLRRAAELGLPVSSRSHFLARIFNQSRGIAVAGSSGKSTITAMAARIMDAAGLDPTVINGAVIPEYRTTGNVGNLKLGNSDYLLIETDESDGSVAQYHSEVGILANISKDHKPLCELKEIFSAFLKNIKSAAVVNMDCPYVRELCSRFPDVNMVSFALEHESNIHPASITRTAQGSSFRIEDVEFRLSVPGLHNVANALAAIALGRQLGISLTSMSQALSSFRGVARRLERVGCAGGITVFDDFAHNPAKIAASLSALRNEDNRIILLYQPHGYGPTRFFKDELVETFNNYLTSSDYLILLNIYYAGGTAEASISSTEILSAIHKPHAEVIQDRQQVPVRVLEIAQPGDVVIVMGARDPTLSNLARLLVTMFEEEKPSCCL